jgi:hypothetical protein
LLLCRSFFYGQSIHTYDSPCWKVLRFKSKKERDEYVEKYQYQNGNICLESISKDIAEKILGKETNNKIWEVYAVKDNAEIMTIRFI